MKRYSVEITIKYTLVLTAKNKKEAKEKAKTIFKDEKDIELTDEEIKKISSFKL